MMHPTPAKMFAVSLSSYLFNKLKETGIESIFKMQFAPESPSIIKALVSPRQKECLRIRQLGIMKAIPSLAPKPVCQSQAKTKTKTKGMNK